MMCLSRDATWTFPCRTWQPTARALLLLEGEEVHKQHDRRVSENVRHGAIAVQVLLHLHAVFAQAMRRAEVLGGTGPGHALEGPEVMYVSSASPLQTCRRVFSSQLGRGAGQALPCSTMPAQMRYLR